MTSSQFRPGDIVLVNLNKNNSSVIISKKRPAIIVSNNDTTRTSSLLHVVPLTTSTVKHYSPTHVKFKRNNTQNIALCEQVTTVSSTEIETTNDWVSDNVLNKIKDRIKTVFDIN